MRALILSLAVVGCVTTTPSSSQPDLASTQIIPDLATTGGLTDAQRCDMACAKLTTCGVAYGAGCSTACQTTDTLLPCLRSADLTDCNALALCSFKQQGKDFCGGTSGVPSGTTSCNDSADCEASCNVNHPGVLSCTCDCVAGLLPIKAINLLINNQCAANMCSTECGPTGSGAACNTCAAQKCVTEHAQCASQ